MDMVDTHTVFQYWSINTASVDAANQDAAAAVPGVIEEASIEPARNNQENGSN